MSDAQITQQELDDRRQTLEARVEELDAELANLRSELQQLEEAAAAAGESLFAFRTSSGVFGSDRAIDAMRLRGRISEVESGLAERRAALKLIEEQTELLAGRDVSDPQALVTEASQRFPFVLLPVRLETRFAVRGDDRLLLVRLFPEAPHAQTRRPGLDAEEERLREQFVADIHEYGRAEAERDLVERAGASRAAWIALINDDRAPGVSAPSSENALGWLDLLPTRWVVMLRVGDQTAERVISAPVAESVRAVLDQPQDGDEAIGSLWLRDFTEAERLGMAVTVRLTPAVIQAVETGVGIDVYVVGVDHELNAAAAAERIEVALTGHAFGNGLRLIPKGSPTNNTMTERVARRSGESATFAELSSPPAYPDSDGWMMPDAAKLEVALGLAPQALARIARPDGALFAQDELDARHMAAALWAVSQGYRGKEIVNQLPPYGHFTRYVRPGGALPAVAFDDMPYGFAITGATDDVPGDDLGRKILLLTPFGSKEPWEKALKATPAIPNGLLSSPEKFLDLIRLTASSQTYRIRQGTETAELGGFDELLVTLSDGSVASVLNSSWLPLIRFSGHAREFTRGLVVDADADAPLPAQYLRSLIDQFASMGAPTVEVSVPDEIRSKTLLYLLLRYSAHMTAKWAGWLDAELPPKSPLVTHLVANLGVQPGQLSAYADLSELQASLKPPGLVQAEAQGLVTPSDIAQALGSTSVAGSGLDVSRARDSLDGLAGRSISGSGIPGGIAYDPEIPVDFDDVVGGGSMEPLEGLPDGFGGIEPGDPEPDWPPVPLGPEELSELLAAQVPMPTLIPGHLPPSEVETVDVDDDERAFEFADALNHLATLAPEALERLMTETLDAAGYRRDAWVSAIHARHLEQMRDSDPTGSYLGAYGFVLGLRPQRQPLLLTRRDGRPFAPHRGSTDSSEQGGFIAAQTSDQAAALAVVRNAYLTHANEEAADALRLNLSSKRVREGLELIDAVREGNAPADVIGARFERLLYRRNGQLIDNGQLPQDGGIAQHLPRLREVFPQRQGPSASDEWKDRVVDGVALLEAWREQGGSASGMLGTLPSGHAAHLEELFDELDGVVDAANDLLLFEATFRSTRGETEAATRALDAHAGMAIPGELESVRTPATGIGFSHRLVVSFSNLPDSPWQTPQNLLAVVSPRLNHLAGLFLGDPNRIKWGFAPVGSSDATELRSLESTALDAIDFVWSAEAWSRSLNDPEAAVPLTLAQHLDSVAMSAIAPTGAGQQHTLFLDRAALAAAGISDDDLTIPDVAELALRIARTIRAARALQPDDLSAAGDESGGVFNLEEGALRLEAGIAALDSSAASLRSRAAQLAAVQAPSDLGQAALDVARDVVMANLNGATLDPRLPSAMVRPFFDDYLDSVTRAADRLDELALNTRAQIAKVTSLGGSAGQEMLVEVAAALVGRDMPFVMDFDLLAPESLDAAAALNVPPSELRAWTAQTARILGAVSEFELATLLSESVDADSVMPSLQVTQLPIRDDGGVEPWIGGVVQIEEENPIVATTSLVQFGPGELRSVSMSGLALGVVNDRVPLTDHTGGVAFRFDQPSARAPQAIAIAVPSATHDGQPGPLEEQAPGWRWEDLVGAVDSLVEESRLRAADPNFLDGVGPALPMTLYPTKQSYPFFEIDLHRLAAEDDET